MWQRNRPTMGTYEWSESTNGKLRLSEKGTLLLQLIGAQAHEAANKLAWGLRLSRASRRNVDMSRLKVPDSAFVKEVESLVEQQHSPALLAHCYRTWAFGWTVGEAFDLKPDPEALYAACLMHDLGLSTGCQHQIKDTGFQILGARKAYGICHEQQQGEVMGRLIYEAISQHLNPWLSPKKVSPEAFLLKTGAHMDVIGIYRHWLSHEAMTVIHERYPRTEFVNEIADTMINLPHHSCSHAGFLNGLGFEKLALKNPLNKIFTASQYAKQ